MLLGYVIHSRSHSIDICTCDPIHGCKEGLARHNITFWGSKVKMELGVKVHLFFLLLWLKSTRPSFIDEGVATRELAQLQH